LLALIVIRPSEKSRSDHLSAAVSLGVLNRGPIRDRIDEAKTKFAWWLLAKWLGFAGGGAAIVFPWLFFIYRALRKLRSSEGGSCPVIQSRRTKRRSPRRPRKQVARNRRRSTKR
jgi:hypothetical protein